MTRAEFSKWWGDFSVRFSTTASWLTSDNSDRELTAMLETWAETLGDVQLEDALAATKGIQAGTLEDWGKNSDRIPAIVRRHAHYRQLQRCPNNVADDPRLPPRSPNGLRFAEMFRYVSKAVEDGVPREQWVVEGLKRLGNVPKEREPRYRCPVCRDTGWVIVWLGSAIRAYHSKQLATFKARRTCAVSCTCRGERKGVKSYDEMEHCITFDDGRSERDIANLEKFLAESAMSGSDFADYNRSAGHIA